MYSVRSLGSSGEGYEDESDEDPEINEDQKQELVNALSLAFGSSLVKENSKLTKFLADTWLAQAQLDESLLELKEYC